MSLIFAWSNPGVACIACDRMFTDYNTSIGTTAITRSEQLKLRECTNGYYAVAGTLISGGEEIGSPYDISAGVGQLMDPEKILGAFEDGYRNAYAIAGRLVESLLGEAKADLTMLVEGQVKVLEMNHGQVSRLDLAYSKFTCSPPRDFTGSSTVFQQILALILKWSIGRLELEPALVQAWSLVLPHTQEVSRVFDVGVHVGKTHYRKSFRPGSSAD